MKRQAFINWERIAEDNIPESGKEYMVAEVIDDEVAKLRFATWYNKGDIVSIESKALKDIDEMTSEERLLQVLFGAHKDYTVRKSGFYLQTRDYGVDEQIEDGAFADCVEMLIALGNDIFFAEKPLVPEGYLSEEQKIDENKAESNRIKAKMKEDAIDKIKFAMENNGVIKGVINSMIEEREILDEELVCEEYRNGNCTVSTFEIAKTVVMASELIDSLANIYKAEGGQEGLLKTLKEADKMQALSKTIVDVVKNNMVEDLGPASQYLVSHIYYIINNGDFYYYRNGFIINRKCDSITHLMMKAHLTVAVMENLARCYRLKQTNAPEIIMINAVKLFTKDLIELQNIKNLEIKEDMFAKRFGVNVDGSEYDGLCSIGNLEKLYINEVEEEDTCLENEVVDEYIVEYSPNYACLEGCYSLWNPKLEKYYRADGNHVSVFKTVIAARDAIVEINKK